MDDFSDSDFLRGLADGMSVVRRWVQRNEIIAQFDDEDRECSMQFSADACDLLVRIVLDRENDASLSVFVHPQFEVPTERSAAIVEACNLINVAMLLGSFEYDPDERSARYRYLLVYPPGQLDSELFDSLVDGCLDSANRGVLALVAVARGEKSPAEAIALLADSD